jgi:hypothetical protein
MFAKRKNRKPTHIAHIGKPHEPIRKQKFAKKLQFIHPFLEGYAKKIK